MWACQFFLRIFWNDLHILQLLIKLWVYFIHKMKRKTQTNVAKNSCCRDANQSSFAIQPFFYICILSFWNESIKSWSLWKMSYHMLFSCPFLYHIVYYLAKAGLEIHWKKQPDIGLAILFKITSPAQNLPVLTKIYIVLYKIKFHEFYYICCFNELFSLKKI
jgi:hypothetical protein